MDTKINRGYNLRKRSVLNLVSEYQKYIKADWSQQEAYHDEQLRNLISISTKSPWWRNRILESNLKKSDSFLTRLHKIPILTRSELQQFALWMKVWIPGSNVKHYETFHTSGSTGKPVTITKYKFGHANEQLAVQLLDAIWQKRDMTKPFAQLRVNADYFETDAQVEPFCYLGPTGMNYGRKLTGISLIEILEFLAEKEIHNFLINPVALNVLSKVQLQAQIPGINVAQILTWGDKLEQVTRELAKEAFGAKVCDRYSAEESSYLAIQCPHSEHLHPVQFFNYIEILDKDNQPCDVGELGRVVVTAWHSYGMPLIRYELGDMASWGKPCEFGIQLPVLEPTIVRIRDIQTTPSGHIVLPRLDKTVLTKLPMIADFQIAQFNNGVVAVIRTFSNLESNDVEKIRVDLSREFPGVSRIELLHSSNIDWLELWKRKVVARFDYPIPEPLSENALKSILLNRLGD